MCIGGYVICKWYLKNEIILLKRNRITFDHWSDTATIIIFFPNETFYQLKKILLGHSPLEETESS